MAKNRKYTNKLGNQLKNVYIKYRYLVKLRILKLLFSGQRVKLNTIYLVYECQIIECHYFFDFKKLKNKNIEINKVGSQRSKEPFNNCLLVNRECTSINVSRLKALKSCD